MGRFLAYSAIFALAAFVVLLALRVAAFAAFEVASLLASVTPNEQVNVYAVYLGFAGATAWFMVPVIVFGMVGAALGFWLLPRDRLPHTGVVLVASAVFAVAMFFLDAAATRLVGQSLWSIGIVALACLLSYAAGRVLSSNAA